MPRKPKQTVSRLGKKGTPSGDYLEVFKNGKHTIISFNDYIKSLTFTKKK